MVTDNQIEDISKSLAKKIDKEIFERKSAPAKEILTLVGAGTFLGASIIFPGLPMALKPFLTNLEEKDAWKRFNIPYLKRTLKRLEDQKLVEFTMEQGLQVVKITNKGRTRILKFAIDELAIGKPKSWDKKWRLVSYDIPMEMKRIRDIFREYLKAWEFYPLHESVFLHAYPCLKQVDFIREYLGIVQYVRVFIVSSIENDKVFKDFFDI